MGTVQYDSNRLSVRVMADRYEKGVLRLEPAFQRQSARQVAGAVFQGCPIPSIFPDAGAEVRQKIGHDCKPRRKRAKTFLLSTICDLIFLVPTLTVRT